MLNLSSWKTTSLIYRRWNKIPRDRNDPRSMSVLENICLETIDISIYKGYVTKTLEFEMTTLFGFKELLRGSFKKRKEKGVVERDGKKV